MAFMLHPRTIDRDRAWSALGVASVHAVLAYALLAGLGGAPATGMQEALATFDLSRPPPPPHPPAPPPRPLPERAPRKAGAAAPPNLASSATAIVAPDLPVPIPPPVVVALLPGPGADAASGNADRPGPGTGSGGTGAGTGSGDAGDGPGGGGGGRPARLVKRGLGSLACRTPETGCPSSEVGIRFTVGTDGRAAGCVVTRSSGDSRTDEETCRRIEQRLRYDPARDRAGRKIAQPVTGTQYWDSVVAEADTADPREED